MEILLLICAIVFILSFGLIFYFDAYTKLSDTDTKMKSADENITNKLQEKLALMEKLRDIIKKNIKKKDYLKEFASISNRKLNNYELDSELSEHLKTMNTIKEDYKAINNKEYNDILNDIEEIDEEITANKKYFNKYNNKLIKIRSGFTKIIAKIKRINVRTSYDINSDEE